MAITYSNKKAYNLIWSPMGRYPMIDNTIFSTLQEATTFAKTNAVAVVGSVVSVVNDGDNNGIYYLVGTEGQLPTGLLKSSNDVEIPIKGITVDGQMQTPDSNGIVAIVIPTQDLSEYAKKSDITSVYRYKNSVATYENLPTSGQTVGDVYNVESDDNNYAWNGTSWDKLGGTVSLEGYLTTESAESTYVKQEGYIAYSYDEKTKLAGIESNAEVNIIETVYVKTNKDSEAVALEVTNKGITIDLSNLDSRLDIIEAAIGTGSDVTITDIIESKQDKLDNGSVATPHLVWDSTNTKWTPGKITIDSIVPSENKAANSVLAYDGEKVIWTTVEVQPELPSIDKVAGKILTVSSDGVNVEWADAPNNTTITNTTEETVVVSSIISNGSEEVEVYSKEGVNKLLSWESL